MPGETEVFYVSFRLRQSILEEDDLLRAEQLAAAGKNRSGVRQLHALRGEWQLSLEHWAEAATSFHEAVRMAHESGKADIEAEASYALANFHLHQLVDINTEIERLSQAKQPPHYTLAKLLQVVGEDKQAAKYALAAYKEAWADGEPYVFRYELNQARALLQELGVAVPDLPSYDPTQDEKLLWEDEVRAAIEQLKADKPERK